MTRQRYTISPRICGTSILGAALSRGFHTPHCGSASRITKIRLVHTAAICFAPQYLSRLCYAWRASPSGVHQAGS